MLNRLFQNWVYATPPIALLLMGLYPFFGTSLALPLFLSLPVYMIHQYEEHDDNRFAVFLNGIIGTGRKGISPTDVWIINVVLVWFFLLAVFYLATFDTGWGVLAAYLLLINGVLHIVWWVVFQKYNPGLWSSVFLFVPLAIWIFFAMPASFAIHIVSAILVIILHAAIMILARRRS
ncbi:MAG: HXXEE domain-containing protein [Pseudomonadota bacterium]